MVVDVSNSPSFEDQAVMEFFRTSTGNLLAAEAAAGVRHHVALSVVGLERLPHSGYFRAKVAQEKLIKESSIPYSIVRATQFFEFITTIADTSTDRHTVHLPPALFQPIAADDVVSAVGRIAVGAPLNGTVEVAGPEQFRLDEIVRWALSTYDDPRKVVTDMRGRYFGSELQERTLVAGQGARLGEMRFEDWLRRSTPPIPMEDPLLVAIEAELREPPALKENEFHVTDVATGIVLPGGRRGRVQRRGPVLRHPVPVHAPWGSAGQGQAGRLDGDLPDSRRAVQRHHGRGAARSGAGSPQDLPRDRGRRRRARGRLGAGLNARPRSSVAVSPPCGDTRRSSARARPGQVGGDEMGPKDNLRHYTSEAIDITYDARRCIHAAECVRGLPEVFDTGRRPWILPSGASADAIAAVIERCPSGALHYTRRDGGAPEAPPDQTTIAPVPGGPLYVRGLIQLRSADGSLIVEDTRLALCRCGQSQNKPFCDNSHLGTGFDEDDAHQE